MVGGAVTRVVQITDCHLFADPAARLAGVDTLASLSRVVERVRQAPPPDLLLVTGDLAQDGEVAAYRRLAERLAPIGAPVMAIPGNHDDAPAMAAALPQMQLGGRRTLGRWRVAGLDSQVPGEEGGRLSSGTLAELERRLAEDDGFWLIALHHPPVSIGSRWMDAMGLANGAQLMGLLERYQERVRAVVWGHNHQLYDGCHGDIRLLGTPSTCVQYAPGADQYRIDPLPPGFRWLELDEAGAVTTGVVRLAGDD